MPNIGLRIRELRQQRGQTLEQVAAETGLSVSFLSMVERDKASISVDNLERLAAYYQVHMVTFFSTPEQSPVLITRRSEVQEQARVAGKGPAAVTLLTNRPNARMEPLLVHIAPGQEEPHFRQHQADTLLYILEGEGRLISETGEVHDIAQGDLVTYINYPHQRLANTSPTQPLVLLMITAPPTSSLDDLVQARQGSWLMEKRE